MKKFKVEIVRRAYQTGTYELEAPDEDAAYILAQDIGFNDQRITWQEYTQYAGGYPRFMDIGVTEVKE